MSYDGGASRRATAEIRNNPLAKAKTASPARREDTRAAWPKLPDGKPDFDRMTSEQRLAYDLARLA